MSVSMTTESVNISVRTHREVTRVVVYLDMSWTMTEQLATVIFTFMYIPTVNATLYNRHEYCLFNTVHYNDGSQHKDTMSRIPLFAIHEGHIYVQGCLINTHYRGLEADTATYRSDTVLYVSECLIVNIWVVTFVLTYYIVYLFYLFLIFTV